jgi:hypothetical protein
MRRLTASGSRAIRDIDAAIGRQPCGRGEQAGGLDGLGEGHRRQDGGEPPCQHRLARPWGTKEEQIVSPTAILSVSLASVWPLTGGVMKRRTG